MNSAKIKASKPKGCGSTLGTFDLSYDQKLYGVIEPSEFETTIRTLNSKTSTKMPKSFYLVFIPLLVGVILMIVGIAKFATAPTEINMVSSSSSSSSYSISTSTSSTSSFSSSSSSFSTSSSSSFSSWSSEWNLKNKQNGDSENIYKAAPLDIAKGGSGSSNENNNNNNNNNNNIPEIPKENLLDDSVSVNVKSNTGAASALIGVGIVLIFCSIIGLIIGMVIISKKVESKIKAELEIINQHFHDRRIRFSLEHEVVEELVDTFEYNTHKNNKAYMNSIEYDIHGRPVKRVTVHFILITFPAPAQQVFQQQQIHQQQPFFNTNPNISISMNI